MQIHELNALGRNLTNGDKFVVDTGEVTAKIDYDALTTAIIGKLGGDPVTIAHGGTGATSAAAARNALGLGNTDGALPVANGGTGATSAAAARNALGVTELLNKVGNGAFYIGSINSGATKYLTTTASSHAIVFTSGPNADLFGIFMIRLSSDTPNIATVFRGSKVTFTGNTGEIAIGNTTTNASMRVNVIPLSNDSSYFTLS